MKLQFDLDINRPDVEIDRALHNIARQFSIGGKELLSGTVEVDGVVVGSWKRIFESKEKENEEAGQI